MAETFREDIEQPLAGQAIFSEEDERIARVVMRDFTAAHTAVSPKHAEFADYLQHYRNAPQIRRHEGQANITTPMAAEHVDALRADMIEKMFSSDGMNFDVIGREGADKYQADSIRELIRYQLTQINGKAIMRDLLFMFLVYGTAPYKVIYDEEYEYVPMRIPVAVGMNGEAVYGMQRTRVLRYKGPKIIPIDIYDFFPHKNLVSIDDKLPICQKIYRPLSYLRHMQERGIYRNVDYIPVDKTGNASLQAHDTEQRQRRADMGIQTGDGVHEGIEFVEWEGWAEYEGEEQWCIATVAPGNIVMRFEPSEYYERMYGAMRMFQIAGEFWGMGIIEKNHHVIHAHNAVMMVTLDEFYQSVNPPTVIAETVDDAEMVARAGQLIHVPTDGEKPLTNYVYRMQPQMVSQDAYMLMDRLSKYGEDLTARTEIKQGHVPSSDQTATAVQTSFTQASIRFKDMLFMAEETGPLVMWRKMHKINRQFLDQPYVISVVGKYGIFWPQQIDPETIAADVDFISLASTRELDRNMNIQQTTNLLNVVMTDPMLAPAKLPLFFKLAEESKIPNLEELKEVMQRWAQEYQRYIMLQMQQQQEYGQLRQQPGVSPATMPQATNTQDQLNSMMQTNRNAVAPRIQ